MLFIFAMTGTVHLSQLRQITGQLSLFVTKKTYGEGNGERSRDLVIAILLIVLRFSDCSRVAPTLHVTVFCFVAAVRLLKSASGRSAGDAVLKRANHLSKGISYGDHSGFIVEVAQR